MSQSHAFSSSPVKAPGFNADHWPAMTDEKWNRELHSYYDRAPCWE
jgi:hypothetical protein